jgi:hypothetical protein
VPASLAATCQNALLRASLLTPRSFTSPGLLACLGRGGAACWGLEGSRAEHLGQPGRRRCGAWRWLLSTLAGPAGSAVRMIKQAKQDREELVGGLNARL